VVEAMERIRLPFNVGVPALAAATAALGDDEFVDRSVEQVAHWRPQFMQRLTALGLETQPSGTNFMTIGFPDRSGLTAPEVEAKLAARGVLVRGLAGYGLPAHLRITIGDDAANRRVLSDLEAIFAG
jgi:histidinol-phosphate aminotransferase